MKHIPPIQSVVGLLVLMLALCTIVNSQARAADDPEVTEAITTLNAARLACGLEPVTLSPALSDGCRKHAKYLLLNRGNPLIAGLKAHEEHESLPGYTTEGATAAQFAVIHFVPPKQACVEWLATFYHRIPLLQPTLKEIGVGYHRDENRWICVIDCMSGNVGEPTRDVVFYPNHQQTDVPLSYRVEIPTPLPEDHRGPAGFPITITFAAEQKVKDVTFSLKDAQDNDVPVHLSTPQNPASSWPQWNTVCAIPRQPLPHTTPFTATLTCNVDEKPFTRTWQFSTTQESAKAVKPD